jgi:hypothetical protein
VGVEEHQSKVLELAVHGDRLVLLRRARHVDAVLRLALGDDAWGRERKRVCMLLL